VQVLRDLIERMQGELKFEKTRNEALNFEIARLKRWRFGSSSESLAASTQAVLFDAIVVDTALEDRAAQEEIKQPSAIPSLPKRQAVRQALPANLPRIERHHEIEQTHCACGQAFKRIGEEVSEQLDCVPAQFFVLRHIRGKYACACCQTIQAAPMPAQIIDKGIPAPGLLAQVVIAKHDDHLPLYRQSEIYARSGVHIARSSMAQWVGICGVRLTPLVEALREFILRHSVIHADETPVSLLAPGRGKTKRAYVWVYRTTNFVTQRAVLFDFTTSRAGEHPRRVLQGFGGTLVTDDYSGYHASQSQGVVAALCWAHYLERGFIWGPIHEVATCTRHGSRTQPRINPARSMCLGIRSTVPCVCRRYGHSIFQGTATRSHAECPGHPARVARRSLRQRQQRAAIPAMDRPVPPLLPRPRS